MPGPRTDLVAHWSAWSFHLDTEGRPSCRTCRKVALVASVVRRDDGELVVVCPLCGRKFLSIRPRQVSPPVAALPSASEVDGVSLPR